MHVHRRVEEQPEIQWRVEARATSAESHFSLVGRSVVEEAVMAAHVYKHDLEVRESEAARGIFPETTEVTGFLGFPYGRPRSTPVWLVSLGEVLICTDL